MKLCILTECSTIIITGFYFFLRHNMICLHLTQTVFTGARYHHCGFMMSCMKNWNTCMMTLKLTIMGPWKLQNQGPFPMTLSKTHMALGKQMIKNGNGICNRRLVNLCHLWSSSVCRTLKSVNKWEIASTDTVKTKSYIQRYEKLFITELLIMLVVHTSYTLLT